MTRKVQDAATGAVTDDSQIITIEIKPGYKAGWMIGWQSAASRSFITGTKFTFNGAGDALAGQPPQDLVFVIEEKPHAVRTCIV